MKYLLLIILLLAGPAWAQAVHIRDLPVPLPNKPYVIDAVGNCWSEDQSMRYKCPIIETVKPKLFTEWPKHYLMHIDGVCTISGVRMPCKNALWLWDHGFFEPGLTPDHPR